MAKKKKDAVASENVFTGSKLGGLLTKEEIHTALNAIIPNKIKNDDVVFLCIGTDRSCGDSMAPFVGTYLTGLGYQNVYGTIDEPVHAMNLQETIEQLPKDKKIIAIDAALGKVNSVGSYQVINGSITPGAGVNKDLGKVGDYSINGMVNVGGFMEYEVLQNTRLSRVIKMAKDITSAIVERFPLVEQIGNEVVVNVNKNKTTTKKKTPNKSKVNV